MADRMLIDGLIKFCEEKSKNIKLKAEPQVFVEIKQALEELKVLKEKYETLKALYEDARKEGSNLIEKERVKAIDEFVSALVPRLTDAIYPKDVVSMTNLINGVARELKEGEKNG